MVFSKLTWGLLLTTLFAVIVFVAFPQLDLSVSRWFYSVEQGGFPYRHHPLTVFCYYLIRIITTVIAVWCIVGLLIAKFKPHVKLKIFPAKSLILFVLIAMILGPGLIVHQGFKEHWERARPVNIIEFGGTEAYTPPLEIAQSGGKSFISGHAAMGFFVAVFAFLATGRRRCYIYCAGIGFGIIVSLCRIAQGGHFLSDTVFAGLVTLLTIQLVRWLIVKEKT